MFSKKTMKNSQFASLNSKSNVIFDNALNNNSLRSVLAEECSCILFVTIFTVSFTLTVTFQSQCLGGDVEMPCTYKLCGTKLHQKNVANVIRKVYLLIYSLLR